ncbi:hypothetical protein LPJ60_006629, partial [Coemansia sp. RSA 2675]
MVQQVCEISEQLKVLGQFIMVASLAPENDPYKPVYHKHVECYKCIIKMLNKHCDSMLNSNSLAMLPNNDALF